MRVLALSIAAIGAAMAFEVPSSTLLLSSRAPSLCHARFTRPMAVTRAGVRAGRAGLVQGMSMTSVEVKTQQLAGAKAALRELIDQTNANPIMVRLAWHDSGTYDSSIKEFPKAGGATGSIRFDPEIHHGANAGLTNAVKLLEPIKQKFPAVSYADLFQMASAVSIELAGGPKIAMKYGRVDAAGPRDCSPEGNLPDAEAGASGKFGGKGGTASTEDSTAAGHLRKVFYRMGLGDEEIVALSGAHTIGRAYKDRSGLGKEVTKFTDGSKVVRADGKAGSGKAGGSSWTEKWLTFDNSYFTTIPDPKADPELLKLTSDRTLFEDPGFKPFAEKFRDSNEAFFESYAKAHKRLSELGSKFNPPEGIILPEDVPKKAAPAPAPKKAAAKAPAGGSTSDSSMGFTGVPADFSRPSSAYAAEPKDQTFLGMRGPRAAGHREKFGGKHAAVSLAMAALLFQPISQAGMYSLDASGALSKQSFSNLEVPGFGNVKKVPTIESFFPFAKNGFDASPVLFGKNSMVVVEDPRGGCGAMNSEGSCHTFLDEMSDMFNKKPDTLPRSEGKPLYFTQWSYEHAAWKK